MSKEEASKLAALASKNAKEVDPIDSAGSWIDIERSQFSYEGRLYPEQYRFQVKPVVTKTIKYFSMLDEANPMSVNDALTYIVQHHIRILDGNRALDTLSTIYEHDRFFFVMLVHVYSGAPTSLSFKSACTHSSCKTKQEINITPYILQYEALSEKANEWLNTKTGAFIIDTKVGQFIYRPLTLQESIHLTEFAMNQRRDNTEIESLFTKVAPLLMASNDGMKIPDIYQEYLTLTSDKVKLAVLLRILEHVEPKQLLEVEPECVKCKRPFRSPISSIAGLRNIFVVHDIDDYFNA